MKKKRLVNKEQFYESITSGVAPENDWIIKAMMKKCAEENAAERAARRNKLKSAGAAVLATTLIAGSAIGATQILDDTQQSESKEIDTPSPAPYITNNFTPSVSNPNFEVVSFSGIDYYRCTPECALELARQSMIRVQNMLQDAGATPVAQDDGEFYPQYYNEYMLAGIAMTESSLRVSATNGEPVISKDGAMGLMQIMPQTLLTINKWLVDTMGITDIQYTTQDLLDPEKSMDIANLTLIWISKNYCKPNCNNPIYKMMGNEFSLSEQQKILIAAYEQGPNELISHIQSGKINYYLNQNISDNYLSKVLYWQNHFKLNYAEKEQ